jgi:hypothetical protein
LARPQPRTPVLWTLVSSKFREENCLKPAGRSLTGRFLFSPLLRQTVAVNGLATIA